jgi:hypothetical protein
MNAVIITPVYSHAHEELDLAIKTSGIPSRRLYGHSDLPRARSLLIEIALQTGAERVIFVDADTIPAPDHLRALAQSPAVTPERAVWGLYPLREGDRWSVQPEGSAEAAERAIARAVPFPIRQGGLGLAAVHRESLARLGDTLPYIGEGGFRWRPFCVPFYRPGIPASEGVRYYADDYSLCVRLRETGTALWCHPEYLAGHAVPRVIRSLQA